MISIFKFIQRNTAVSILTFDFFIWVFATVLAIVLTGVNINQSSIRSLLMAWGGLILVRFFIHSLTSDFRSLTHLTTRWSLFKMQMYLLISAMIMISINYFYEVFLSGKIVYYRLIISEFFIISFIMLSFRYGLKLLYLENVFTDDQEESKAPEKQISNRYLEKQPKAAKNVNSVKNNMFSEIKERVKRIELYLFNEPYYNLNFVEGEFNTQKSQKHSKTTNVSVPRSIDVEKLLDREPIELNEKRIANQVYDGVIMVTGAAGSIGSEIVRQLTRFNPKKIILFDQAETPMFEIENEMNEKMNFNKIKVVIGDVTNKYSVNEVFGKYKPNIVYHAAAYKHVPMMENNPSEAVLNNVIGTKTIADAAIRTGAKRFVLVSTDKAVNPTNVMGATKRMAEIYTQSLNGQSKTRFITTRFGNVLGSNGSVIPRFQQQIEAGGPVTVTHPDITRYFMTIPEACQLVLEAGAMGNGGEIFLFDMGQPVKIRTLARRLIEQYNMRPNSDIEIKYTGLRPGEKLYEELLAVKEKTLPTHNEKIMIAKVRRYEVDEIAVMIQQLKYALSNGDNYNIVQVLKKYIPEYVSNNSKYQVLDGVNINQK